MCPPKRGSLRSWLQRQTVSRVNRAEQFLGKQRHIDSWDDNDCDLRLQSTAGKQFAGKLEYDAMSLKTVCCGLQLREMQLEPSTMAGI